MHPTLTTLFYSLAIIWYYIKYGLLTPIAYIFNISFLIYHPDLIFPTNIAPPRNTTIHSFTPTGEMHNYIMQHSPPPPPLRQWFHPQQLQNHLSDERPFSHAITLEGEVNGPPLRQGTVIIQNSHVVYIQNELGRWPTRDDYLTTTAISLIFNNSFRLFLPVRQMDRQGLIDYSDPSPFRNPLPLAHIVTRTHQLKDFLPSPSSNV